MIVEGPFSERNLVGEHHTNKGTELWQLSWNCTKINHVNSPLRSTSSLDVTVTRILREATKQAFQPRMKPSDGVSMGG